MVSLRRVQRNAGPALFEDERLRVLGDAFQQLDVSPVASSFQHFSFQLLPLGLALFRVVIM